MLPVTLDYLRPVFCEPNVASVSGLFSSNFVLVIFFKHFVLGYVLYSYFGCDRDNSYYPQLEKYTALVV